MNGYVIRGVRAEDWAKVKELRIAALRDPVAPVAFLQSLEEVEGLSDGFWQDRAGGAALGGRVRQFVAEGAGGEWVGTVTVLIEEAGTADLFDGEIEQTQGHLVGVFVRPEQRGTGLTEALFDAALEWSWALEEPVLARVRLFVHEENGRAAAFYRRFGFVPSGKVVPMPTDPSAKELEYVFPRPV
ncbi:GNAT family N-acetyltransferase [Streptomyces sp. NBC_01264]|uniref:GNAT family N-acetyltransferase n=1 Tax=Streptomyces sp. NBC_01264 TaxID=2903804 RepID=UPI0022576C29|nr:GNAT family N-acetyltransferase [Streptomyces sp. NBC_01264]MCX4779407.1 GNAT family N-acetyltransferase [Streptomyces sp. NBC_01264]